MGAQKIPPEKLPFRMYTMVPSWSVRIDQNRIISTFLAKEHAGHGRDSFAPNAKSAFGKVGIPVVWPTTDMRREATFSSKWEVDTQ